MVTVSSKNTTALGAGQKQWVEYVTCDKTEQCTLYKEQGKCACYRWLIGRNMECPNGEWHRLEGYTKRAKAFSEFAKMVAEKYAPTAKEYKDKLCLVADYVFLPMSYLDNLRNPLHGIINGHFVKEEQFNEDFVESIVKYRPLSFFGYEAIKDYTQKELPKFVQQLKEEMPLVYAFWCKKYPESAKKFEDISPVGRTAYVSTLPSCDLGGGWIKRGNYLINDECKDTLFGGRFKSKKPLRIQVDIEDDMVVKVTEKIKTGERTKYVD